MELFNITFTDWIGYAAMATVLISFLIGFTIKINLINALPIFGEIYTEEKIANNHLAKKYFDSLEKNLFKENRNFEERIKNKILLTGATGYKKIISKIINSLLC